MADHKRDDEGTPPATKASSKQAGAGGAVKACTCDPRHALAPIDPTITNDPARRCRACGGLLVVTDGI